MHPSETNNSRKVFFLYARKSSEGEDRQVQSIDDQVAYFRRICAAEKIVIKEIFTEAKSAKKPYCRPVFAEMLKRVEKGEADGILCWKLDRLARNPVDGGAIMWMLQSNVISQIKTNDRDFYPHDNVLMMSVEFGMANQYIIDMRKNIMRGMDSKAERGCKPGMAPLGYVNDHVAKNIRPDPERFDLVKKMWKMMLTGNYAPQHIRRIANEQWGFRTIRHRTKGNTEMSMAAIYTLFDNIFYTGMFRWKGKLFPGSHTPMISIAEFERVQALLGRSNNIRPQCHVFAYTGLIRCLECHMMFTATAKKKLVKTTGQYTSYIYYHCTRKSKEIHCQNAPIPLKNMEEQIAEEIQTYTIAPEFLQWALKYLESEKAKMVIDVSSAKAMQRKSLAEIEKELDTLSRMRYRDMVDDAFFTKESAKLKDKIAMLTMQSKQESETPLRTIELTEKAFHFATYAYQRFARGKTEDRREIASAFGSNYGIADGKLIFEAAFWLVPIRNAYKDLYEEFKRLELQKYVDTEAWNALLNPMILTWCSVVEEVRIIMERNNDATLHIPTGD